MTEAGRSDDTLKEIIFGDLVRALSPQVLRGTLEHANEAWGNGFDGVTVSTDDCTAAVSVDADRRLNYRFNGWGPFVLGIDRAQTIIEGIEIDESSTPNSPDA